MLRWSQSMPESSTAMPTPRPSKAPAAPRPGGTAEAPVASATRLPVRAVERLGAIDTTSTRAASVGSRETGTSAAIARTESKTTYTEPLLASTASRSAARRGSLPRATISTLTYGCPPRLLAQVTLGRVAAPTTCARSAAIFGLMVLRDGGPGHGQGADAGGQGKQVFEHRAAVWHAVPRWAGLRSLRAQRLRLSTTLTPRSSTPPGGFLRPSPRG